MTWLIGYAAAATGTGSAADDTILEANE